MKKGHSRFFLVSALRQQRRQQRRRQKNVIASARIITNEMASINDTLRFGIRCAWPTSASVSITSTARSVPPAKIDA
jgi:hypothetical protein